MGGTLPAGATYGGQVATAGVGSGAGVGIGVVGLEHLHVYELVDGLCSAGATVVAHTAGCTHSAGFGGWQTGSRPTDRDGVFADPDVALVVVAGVPADRADDAVAALDSGRSVLSDKPGVTTTSQLDRVRAAVDAAQRRWWVLFSERFGVPAVRHAVELARSGVIGRVVAVQGSAPHRAAFDSRPGWFADPERAGSLLVDLATHQVDQFLAVTGADDVGVVHAAAGNVASPDFPDVHDVAELVLVGGGARGFHRVDFLEADGFPSWGDVRLVVTGTAGRLEVRTPVADGDAGSPEVWITDHTSHRRVELEPRATWAEELLADLADGGERLMTREHPFTVSRVVLEAQDRAVPWSS
jgi:predicted dehydrogenase